jgi:hypothetical protein
VSDIFREVEEDVRRERLEKLWKQYGDYVIAAAAVLIIGVAGYKVWQHYEFVQTNKAAAAYLQAMQLAETGNNAEAVKAYAQIVKTAPSGYAVVAQLAEANELLMVGKVNDAVALYKKVAKENKGEIGEAARIRAAWILADGAPKKDLQDLLAPVNDGKSGWRFMAQEILAYVDFRDGRLQAAQSEYKSLAAMQDAPGAIHQRAAAMATLLRTGVGDYGTVPEDAKPDAEKTAAEQGAVAPQPQKGKAKK